MRTRLALFLATLGTSTAWMVIPGPISTKSALLQECSLEPTVVPRRQILLSLPTLVVGNPMTAKAYSGPLIDVNNAMTREFTKFPGLYPTIGTKIVNGAKQSPYKSKKDVYAALDTDLERERLKQYDAAILIAKPDSSLKQYKASQICKYECGGRISGSFRDEQIKAVQKARRE